MNEPVTLAMMHYNTVTHTTHKSSPQLLLTQAVKHWGYPYIISGALVPLHYMPCKVSTHLLMYTYMHACVHTTCTHALHHIPLDPHVAIIKGLLVGGNFCRHDLPVASLI